MTTSLQTPAEIATLRQQFAELERPARPRSTRELILQELMPEIEKKLSNGWRYADLVAGLDALGITISPNTLRNYVARARHNRGKSAASAQAQPMQSKPVAPKRATNASKPAAPSPTAHPATETSSTPAARPHRRAKKTAFVGFDETP